MAKNFKDLAGACWKGYKAVGLKDKNGRKVPNCVPEETQLEEATVSKKDYSWGKMITVHHGKDISYPLHPEHQKIVKNLRPSGEHSKAMYKDETGNQVHVSRENDKVHFVSHKKTGSTKTTVDYKHFDESAPAKNTDVSDKSWLKDVGKKPTIKSDLKNFKNFLTGKKETNEEVERVEEGWYEKPASAYRRKGDEIGGGSPTNFSPNSRASIAKNSKAPVAPVPDKKYIKGTPEHKAYKATKKPINGMPTNEEVEQIDEITHEVGISYDKNAMRAQGKVRVAAKDHDDARTKALDSMKGREKNVKVHSSRNLAKGKETDTVKFNEETGQILEISDDTAASYVHKRNISYVKKMKPDANGNIQPSAVYDKMSDKHKEGINRAMNRLMKPVKETVDREDESDYSISPKTGRKVHKQIVFKNGEEKMEEGYVVRYNNPKSEKHGSEKHFDDQDSAQKHADRGNSVDKIGGKYTVHKTNEKGHDINEGIVKGTAEVIKQAVRVPYRAMKRVAGAVLDTAKDVGDAAANVKKKFKEDFENGEVETNVKTYKQFVESLNEIKMSDLPSRKVSGKYGTEYYKKEAEQDKKGYDDEDKPAKPAGEKRGRGRPAGSTSGARQKGTIAKRKGSGVEMTGYPVHLPNFK